MSAPTTAIIIGAGPAGIAMGYHLKKKLGTYDFAIFDQNPEAGGTWYSNSYPGCGCDVPSHFYSFSFALNPNWSRPLCERDEILTYLNDVIDRNDLRPHMSFNTSCLGAKWDEFSSTWEVFFRNTKTKHQYSRRARVFVSATGFFSLPKYPEIPGLDLYQGPAWHSGHWDHSVDLTGKNIAVIGNGCSGCQVIPAIAPKAKSITHYARSKQWLFARPNVPYTSFQKWCFRNVPMWMRWNRFWIYFNVDSLFLEYVNLPESAALRNVSQKEAYDYMVKTAPKKYLDQLIPDYPVGCKRRVLDPGYLAALHRKNVLLESRKIDHIDEKGAVLVDGSRSEYDAIVYATGFKTQAFLAPMDIVGQGGQTLNDHWKESGGCQAYRGTTVSGFPNFAILFGPNASPAHNSVIYSVEVQVEYVMKTFFEPLLSKRANTIVVKRSAEDYDCNLVQLGLKDSVWHSGCTNWTLNEFGRNCSNFPGYVRSFWWKLYTPKWGDYILLGGEKTWRPRYVAMKLRQHLYTYSWLVSFGIFGAYLQYHPHVSMAAVKEIVGTLRRAVTT